MTLSAPSFLAAATRSSIFPKSATLVAFAASLPDASSFSGGEHAATATSASTVPATAATPRNLWIPTLFLLGARALHAPHPDVGGICTVPTASGAAWVGRRPDRTLC